MVSGHHHDEERIPERTTPQGTQEEGVERPRPVYQVETYARTAMAAQTPIEVGTLDITSRVQLIAEVEVGPR